MHKLGLVILLLYLMNSASASTADPTKPLNVNDIKSVAVVYKPIKKNTEYQLQSIIVSQVDRVVMINEKEYREGDFLDIYQIIKINTDTVLVTAGGKLKTLELYPDAHYKQPLNMKGAVK
jgi:hypothetical protein